MVYKFQQRLFSTSISKQSCIVCLVFNTIMVLKCEKSFIFQSQDFFWRRLPDFDSSHLIMPQDKKLKFTEGERVLCFHGPLLYEAVVKEQSKDKVTKYLVHYNGWNKSWDEWVAESRVVKYNEENLKKQKELKQQRATNKRAKKKIEPGKGEGDKKDNGDPQPKKKRGRGVQVEVEPSYIARLDVRIVIPHDLRRFLLDDCDFVTRQKQLVPLPKPDDKTVSGLLADYKRWKMETSKNAKESVLNEVTKGISEYFDVMLGTQLLYKFERAQYSDLLKLHPDKIPSQLYGSEHLLRLFVKLGSVLSYSNLDKKSMYFVVNYIHDFLDYMTKGGEDMFSSEYETATPEYYRRVAT